MKAYLKPKLILYFILFLPFFLSLGCWGGSVKVNTRDRDVAKVEYDERERQAIDVEGQLTDEALAGLKKLSTLLSEIALSINDNIVKEKLEAAQLLLNSAQEKLEEVRLFIAAFASLAGPPDYRPATDAENLEALRASLAEKDFALKEAERKLNETLNPKASSSSIGSSLLTLSKIVKYFVLAALIIGGVLGTVYIRMLYGNILGSVAGVASLSIVGSYLWLSNKEVVITIVIGLICVAGVVAIIWAILLLSKSKLIVSAVQKARGVLREDEREKVDAALKAAYEKSIFGSSTEKLIQTVKTVEKLPSVSNPT